MGWWATKATGGIDLGSQIELEFSGYPKFVWEIVELSVNERVRLNLLAVPEKPCFPEKTVKKIGVFIQQSVENGF
jgi:hypothetical protein